MPSDLTIRDATTADAAACAAIYTPYVTDTVVSFETEPPSEQDMAGRIGGVLDRYPWLVAEDAGRIVGYAYAHAFSGRAAYRWSCETSIYLEVGRRRTGAGRTLYTALFDRLTARGYRRAFAGISLPNEASTGLHRALGFDPVGVYRQVGWKHGAWRDVAWMQRSLGADPDAPPVDH